MSDPPTATPLSRNGHSLHCKRCLSGLPGTQAEIDSSRVALAFYCLGGLDLLGHAQDKLSAADRTSWREAIWTLQTQGPDGTGFKPSSYMTSDPQAYSEYDAPHLIMTYTALLSLSILRDDFAQLDRPGLIRFLRSCQREDGSFSTVPRSSDSDLRLTYCAFAISNMLDDWSGMDVDSAVAFIHRCRSYEGGYGQEPFGEALGGTTYCALAALSLAASRTGHPASHPPPLTPVQRRQTARWLIHQQDASDGGFSGRTNKIADACYCFWSGTSLEILGAGEVVNTHALARFLGRCQFRFGGIAKAPDEHPDPYHTYLSLAALSVYPPEGADGKVEETYAFEPFDTLLNAREETAKWAREHIRAPR